MKIKKPKFWDYEKPNFLSYLLLPFSLPIVINNFLLNLKKKTKKKETITSICIGNIYVGGTAKTPLSIKISQILTKLNYKNAVIKKFYKDQLDEQKILSKKTKLYCFKTRSNGLDEAVKDKTQIAIFDDGLQDKSIHYDLKFVCFNNTAWIGNGLLIPAGPLRENIQSISKYDAIFLNGNEEDNSHLKLVIKRYNPNIKIFETYYKPININEFNINNKFVIFSGIGNPASFKKTLVKHKFNIIKEFIFPDHYEYTLDDINKIKLYAKAYDVKIITTEKDYVKLHNTDEVTFLEIELAIKQEDQLIDFLKFNI